MRQKDKVAHPRSQCPAKDVTSHKCRKKGNYKKCCKSKTGKQGTTGEPACKPCTWTCLPLTGVNANQTSVRDAAQDYHMMFGPHVPQDDQHTMFHHIQTFHVKSINDTSSKHITPLWLSTASGWPIYQVECEIGTGAGCNVMPLYLHKSLSGDKILTPTSVQIFGYGESPVANLGACTIAIHTGDRQQPQMATCQVTDTRGYLILGRETAQRVGYFAFPEVTPPSLTSTPQIHTSVNVLRPDSSYVNKPTCEVLDDAVVLNGKRHNLPITKEYVLSESIRRYRKTARGQVPHPAQARRTTCTTSTSSSTWEEESSIQRRAWKIVQFGNHWNSSGTHRLDQRRRSCL